MQNNITKHKQLKKTKWEEHNNKPFPTILFSCQDTALLISAKRKVIYLADDEFDNPEELEFCFTTNEQLEEFGLRGSIWEQAYWKE